MGFQDGGDANTTKAAGWVVCIFIFVQNWLAFDVNVQIKGAHTHTPLKQEGILEREHRSWLRASPARRGRAGRAVSSAEVSTGQAPATDSPRLDRRPD